MRLWSLFFVTALCGVALCADVDVRHSEGKIPTVTIKDPSVSPNPAKIGQEVTFKGTVVANFPIPDTGQAFLDFGDGTSSLTLTKDDIPSLSKDGIKHTYLKNGVFTVHIYFYDPTDEAFYGYDYDIFVIVGDGSVALDQSTGVGVIASVANGGTVSLSINAGALFGASTAVTTIEDANGTPRTARVLNGFQVSQKLTGPGLFVATSNIMNANKTMIGKIRKTFGIGQRTSGDPAGLAAPADTSMKTKSAKGKFVFDGSKPDVVSFSVIFTLPPGFSLQNSNARTVSFSLSNVVDTLTFDEKGKFADSQRGRIKKASLKLPKLKDGTADGTEPAYLTVQYSLENLASAGFDTDGITGVRDANQSGKASRLLQVNMLFAGVAYDSPSPVDYVISKDGDFGSISSRAKSK